MKVKVQFFKDLKIGDKFIEATGELCQKTTLTEGKFLGDNMDAGNHPFGQFEKIEPTES